MVHTLTPAADLGTDVEDVARLVSATGERMRDADLDPWVADVDTAQLQGLYRDMVLVRRMDAECMALQRQGQLGLWAPLNGQEAVQVGSARPLREDDFTFPTYREAGVNYVRGAEPAQYMRAWRGEAHSSYNPYDLGSAIQQIIIGAQALHAVGYAMGIQRDGTDQVATVYFGDGASSQGDVNEAMIFAASFDAPVVFICSNNHYAISEPVGVAAKSPIAGRAPGFGIPSMRVDGNDVLAMMAATRWAIARARQGHGPSFIEAVTYRMGPHTTSDDPTRYRTQDEVEAWRRRDPIARVEGLLRAQDAFDDDFTAGVQADADALAADIRTACLGMTTAPAISILDNVYAEPHAGIDEERRWFGAYLDGFADAPAAGTQEQAS
ncbi:pyruvate dehydrogenase [Microbacterium mangrovi]|uniref:2-oxoisovalerate dehydrogenase subunit alpha n=1 Tax=Microbacterium mangrovi TaxID=1348253 RepID=A0A0B1ZX40_9MICO|nr:thiamine pyrophosphate-dependent enzyme [Microbacterium mangrovi]KHK95299.1 pyruvate dehydrogenase [Microbacterium mangrovi]